MAALLAVASCGEGSSGSGPTTVTSPSPTTGIPTTTSPGTSTTSEPSPSTSLAPTTTVVPTSTMTLEGLHQGDEGAAVLALQDRLDALGYWSGEPDGVFGADTAHAVVAVQKVAGIEPDGTVTAETARALADETRPLALSTTGRVIEIDLSHQVLLVVTDGQVDLILDTSTGVRAGTTPVGVWAVTREIDAPHWSALGLLYRPKYFHGGVAIHGYTSVPTTPASHGCVRVTYPAMDHLWAIDALPIGTPVWVYE